MGAEEVVARRRAERDQLIARARRWVHGLDARIGVRAAVVFGSVARGDFNLWSDVDLLVVADGAFGAPHRRTASLGDRPPLVQPVLWTPEEWDTAEARGNPIAVEAVEHGVWLVGSPEVAGLGRHP